MFCFLSLFFRRLGNRSDASVCKFSGLENSRFLSVAILGRGLLVSLRMYRQMAWALGPHPSMQ